MSIVTLNKRIITGLKVRTKNEEEKDGKGKIPKLWESFMLSGLSQKLKTKKSENIYVIYFNYESDFNGFYDCLIGYETIEEEKVERLSVVNLEIPELKFKKIQTDKGKLPKIVIDKWIEIWTKETEVIAEKRSYQFDFEEYSELSMDPENAVVNIYISIDK